MSDTYLLYWEYSDYDDHSVHHIAVSGSVDLLKDEAHSMLEDPDDQLVWRGDLDEHTSGGGAKWVGELTADDPSRHYADYNIKIIKELE